MLRALGYVIRPKIMFPSFFISPFIYLLVPYLYAFFFSFSFSDVTKTGNGEWGMGNGEWGMRNSGQR